MARSIYYGFDSVFQVEVAEGSLVADCAVSSSTPLDDPAAAVAVALDQPLDFPPLRQAIVPGDRIALALSAGIPQADLLVGGVIESLSRTGTELDSIQLVVSQQVSRSALAAIQQILPLDVEVFVHDPDDPRSLAFLTSSRQGNAIYVNRTLHEADVVLPIGSVRLDAERGSFDIAGNLFPAFSDAKTIARFAEKQLTADESLAEEIAEASWLLGVHLTVQIVPGAGNAVLHVLAGESRTTAKESRSLCNAAWRVDLERRASLVIASLQGGAEEQTWENFSRALRNAARAVDDDGAIVLCTQLRGGEGHSADHAGFAEHSQSLTATQAATDAPPISIIEEIRERHNVYLLSELDEEYVEQLGMGFVARAEQISRLARQHASCILLGNAQHVFVDCPSGH